MTGSDILAARDQIEGDFIIMPSTALKSDEAIMLDGMTLENLQQELGLPTKAFDLPTFGQILSANS
jgi:NifB/MoaA-like Fe-S oxidoreductase